jgi:hypothetical protein
MNRTDKTIEWLKNNRVASVIVVAAIFIAGVAATLKNINDIASFFNFKKSDSTKEQPVYPTLPFSEVESIATNLLKEKPAFVGSQNIYGENYILSFTESDKRFTLLKKVNELWEVVQTVDSAVDYSFSPDCSEWEFSSIDSLPSVFFKINSMGNAFGTVSFNLLSFNKDYSYKIYNINVSGRLEESDSGAIFDRTDYEIYRNDWAKQKNAFTSYLEEKLKQYNPVPNSTEEDLNLERPDNAVKAWEVDNSNWINKIDIENDSTTPDVRDVRVKFKYHKEDLSEMFGAEEISDQNDSYILYNIFKYAAIVKEKKTGYYFVALGHRSMSVGGIKLQNEDLFVSDEWFFRNPFLISLKTGALTLLPKVEEEF